MVKIPSATNTTSNENPIIAITITKIERNNVIN